MNVGLSWLRQIQGSTDPDPQDPQDLNDLLTRIRGYITTTFRELVASVTTGYHTEHNANDSHSTIHATGAIYERARTVAIGDFTDVAFNAGNFTASGTMAWTVTVTQQIAYSYLRIGTTLYLNYGFDSTAISGTAAASLRVTLPANLTAAQYAFGSTHYVNGTANVGVASVTPGDRFLSLFRADGTNWSTGSAVTVHGQIAFKVSDTGDVPVTSADPVLTYTGGTINFNAVTSLPLTTAGSYTISVNRAMTLTFKGVAGGGGAGGSACWDGATNSTSKGSGGGGGGGVTTGTTVALVSGKTYTLVIGAGGSGGAGGIGASTSGTNGTAGGNTTLVNTTDTSNLVVLVGGAISNGSTTTLHSNGGAGGGCTTGTNGVTGGSGGNGDDTAATAASGGNATNGAGGGGGGGQSGNGSQSNGGIGGTGSVAGGARGIAGNSSSIEATAGASVSPATGGSAAGFHGGGGGGAGGGCQISGLTGTFGGGGGGAGGRDDSTTGMAGGSGGAGAALFVFVSAP